ncbi:MAG TPA: glycosyltransferase, partial [Pyrinomonadaceae bacterium]|nr:glycosyltransferase [Pyrinomonadaceae bacterium]
EAHHHFANDPQVEMKVIAGPLVQESSWQALRSRARGQKRLRLVRHVTDLCAELSNAAVSISQAGYNTCLDVLRAGVPALLVPFTKEEEDEQRRRALRLESLGLVKVLAQEEQTPERLAAEIRGQMDFKFPKTTLDLGGAQCTVKTIESML